MAGSAPADGSDATVRASVVYALPDRAHCIEVEVADGSTLIDAVAASGLRQREPSLPDALDLGVHGRPQPGSTKVRDGDRIEVYRALTVDPKEARRIRAEIKRRRVSAAR